MTIITFKCLWPLCATMAAAMATYVRPGDIGLEYNGNTIAVLLKQVEEMKTMVKAQGVEIRDLKAVVKTQAEEMQYVKEGCETMGNRFQNMELIAQEQAERIRALEEVSIDSKQQIYDLETRLKVRKEYKAELSVSIEGRNTTDESQTERTSARAQYDQHDSTDKHLTKLESPFNRSHGDAPVGVDDDVKIKNRRSVLSRGIRAAARVAFSTYLTHNLANMGVGQTVKLDAIILNDGGGYNPHTGIFTAPVTGVYYFTYTIETGLMGSKTGVRLVVDDLNLVDAVLAVTSLDSDRMSGNTAIVNVSAGQSAWLQTFYWNDADLRSGVAPTI